jgi:hypothetical protein
MNGAVYVVDRYFNDAGNSWAPPVWTDAMLDTGLESLRTAGTLDTSLMSYSDRELQGLLQALQKYPCEGKDVLVIGSLRPWIELACMHRGAKMVTTVDYNPPVYDGSRIRIISVDQHENKEKERQYDVLLSFSSIEHDGLGRYGDPINPDGDLETMERLKGRVRPGGLLFVGVPNGVDALMYNAHRIYGPIRFPMLTRGWEKLDVFSYDVPKDEIFKVDDIHARFQPWWILTPATECVPSNSNVETTVQKQPEIGRKKIL